MVQEWNLRTWTLNRNVFISLLRVFVQIKNSELCMILMCANNFQDDVMVMKWINSEFKAIVRMIGGIQCVLRKDT